MAEILMLDRSEVERLLDADALLEALEGAFVAIADGEVSAPPRIAAESPDGLVGAMPGWMPGTLAVKLVSVFPGNDARELPSHQGVVLLFDEETGEPRALMDAERITALRTAGAAAVAARALSRPDAGVLAVLGAGVQGRSHLETFPRVRTLREVRIASRTTAHAEALAEEAAAEGWCGEAEIRLVPSFEDAIRGADLVCCCTDAREPVLEAGWLGAGTHVSSVGGTHGRELDEETVRENPVYVEWRGAAEHPFPAGAGELQEIDPGAVVELGEVLAGRHPGRGSPEEITVYKSTGHAAEDAAAARLVLERAREAGAGRTVRI